MFCWRNKTSNPRVGCAAYLKRQPFDTKKEKNTVFVLIIDTITRRPLTTLSRFYLWLMQSSSTKRLQEEIQKGHNHSAAFCPWSGLLCRNQCNLSKIIAWKQMSYPNNKKLCWKGHILAKCLWMIANIQIYIDTPFCKLWMKSMHPFKQYWV